MLELLRKAFREFFEDQCTTLAAALAYYTLFALPPILYLLLTALTWGFSVYYEDARAAEKSREILETQTAEVIGNPQVSDQIRQVLESHEQSSGKWWKGLLSFVGIFVGATGVVAALQTSLNQVWDVAVNPESSTVLVTLRKRLLSLAMILGLGFLMVVSLAVSTVLAGIGDQVEEIIGIQGGSARLINFGVQAAFVFAIFAAIFRVMPDAVVAGKDVVVGAGTTTLLFLLGRFVLQVYFQYNQPGAEFSSAAASLVVLLAWVYYTSLIVLLGAELTQVFARRHGQEVIPEPHAVRRG